MVFLVWLAPPSKLVTLTLYSRCQIRSKVLQLQYLEKRKLLALFRPLHRDVGDMLVVTSGVTKQCQHFTAKAIESVGNLSKASVKSGSG